MLDAAALIIALTALLAWVNARFIRLPTTIGVLSAALLLSLAAVGLSRLGLGELEHYARDLLRGIDFTRVLMQGMLSLLLFAGALHVDLPRLARYRWQISSLALLGTIASTLIIGIGTWAVLAVSGVPLPLPYCLVFGALISPTDPIAVLGILKTAQVPASLEVTIAGEALFNDGIGVVVFTLLLAWVTQGAEPDVGAALALFAREALGGIAYGIAIGWLATVMLRGIEDAHVAILVTVGLALGGYGLASRLQVSGPLAMVIAGLLIGHKGRTAALADATRHSLDTFWDVVDEFLNAILFVLIGLQVIVIAFPPRWMAASGLVIVVTLAARALTVGMPVALFRSWFDVPPASGRVITWAGLRGGISVALALSLPHVAARDVIVMLTYCVVVFSILGQGLTIGPLARRAFGEVADRPEASR